MNEEFSGMYKDVQIVNKLGLHARSAALVAEIAQSAKSDVWLIREGHDAVDARSIIDMLTLACAQGSQLRIQIDSRSDIGVLDDIVSLVERGFGE